MPLAVREQEVDKDTEDREEEDEKTPEQLGEDRSVRVQDLNDGDEVEDKDDQAEERARVNGTGVDGLE